MAGREVTPDIDALLERVLTRVQTPRVLGLRPPEQGALQHAIERARVQLANGPEPILVVALAGCTGAGKSALTNALAGAVIAEVSDKRPTTRRLRVYHHRDTPPGGLPVALTNVAAFVPHDRPELRTKVIIDTPDLDSFVTQHRAITRQVLQAAGLTLYVFSPEKYLEERTWSILRQEQHFSVSAAVLNKVDCLTPDELEQVSADLRQHFADMELGTIRIFRTCAIAHIPRADGSLPPAPSGVDDTLALRAFLERELQASDVARLQRQQHQRVVAHLQEEMERVAPAATLSALDEVVTEATPLAAQAAGRFASTLADRLNAIEEEFIALATLRQHERFSGPLRTWLLGMDCCRFGLKRLGRQLLGSQSGNASDRIADLLTAGTTAICADLLRDAARQLQDALYAHGLPVERWHAITDSGAEVYAVSAIAAEIETHFQNATTLASDQSGAIIRVASSLGSAIPALLVFIGLCVTSRDLWVGHYVGLPLLGHLLTMGILSFLALQGGVTFLLPSLRWRGQALVLQAVQRMMLRTLEGWITVYRSDLEADLADLREPLVALQDAIVAHTEEAEVTAVAV